MSPTVLVTGASAGVGRATANAFARAGYDVGLVARGEAGLAAASDDVKAAGARALAVTADVSRFDEVQKASMRVEDELGPIAIWVNNAMTTVFAPFGEVSPDDFRRAIEVTFLGQVWGTMAALEAMRPRGKGTIVNVGSALAFIGIPLQAPYCAAKFACRGFFESVRAELLHEESDIRMSMVHLPAVNTPQFGWCKSVFSQHPQPVPPIYQPEVCARAIVETALDGQRERVVGSWNKLLVWGARAMPGVGNQFAALGAWDEQLSDRPADPHRPSNLVDPMDECDDAGAHGIFGDRAHGVATPSFLRSLPRAAHNFARALRAAAQERKASHDLKQARKVCP